jgi:cytochrome c oxidase cbb3-type subunit 3
MCSLCERRTARRRERRAPRSALYALLVFTLGACERENRRFTENPPTATPTASALVVSQLQPGPVKITPKIDAPYDDNAWAVSEGKTLYNSMNCSGCHFQGGGGIGPALMNGMPAWKYKLSDQQIWELVSYVRSLSSLIPKGARGGRDDHMMQKTPEASTPQTKPKMSSAPPGAELL